MRRLAYKTMNKNKINKESKNVETVRDKGVNSTDWLDTDTVIDNEQKKLKFYVEEIDGYKQKIKVAMENINSFSSNLKFVEYFPSVPFVILAILQIVCIGLLLFQIFY